MADDKRIGISVDTSGYDEGFNRIQRRADELATDMIRNSRELGQSSKEIIKDLEEQIRVIERRNKLNAQFKQEQLEVGKLRGDISQEKFQSEGRGLKIETAEEKMHTTLLREIADNIKSGNKEQTREARTSAEKLYENIKETEGDEELEPGSGDRPTKGKARGGGVYGVGYTNKIVQAGNIYEAGAGGIAEGTRRAMGLSGMGLIGTLVALSVGKAIQAALPYEQSLGANVGISGGSADSYRNYLRRPGESMAFGMDATLKRRVDVARARATGAGLDEATLESLQLERGLGIDPSMSMSLEKLTRGGGRGAMRSTQELSYALQGVGAMGKGEAMAVPEYLQTLVMLGQNQVKTLGKVSDGNIQMVAGIANLDESFQNPEVLSQVTSLIMQGSMTAQSPQQEALQFSILSQIAPGKSLFEYQLMREDPFSKENRQYIPKTLEMLEKMSMGNEGLFGQNIAAYYKSSATYAKGIRGGYYKGTLVDDLEKEYEGKEGFSDVEKRSREAAGLLPRSAVEFQNFYAETGKSLVSGMVKIKDEFLNAGTEIKDFIKTMKDLNELEKTNYKLAKEQQELAIEAISIAHGAGAGVLARGYFNIGDSDEDRSRGQQEMENIWKQAAKSFGGELIKIMRDNP